MSEKKSTLADAQQRLLDQAGSPNRIESDQGEYEYGSLRDHVALLKYLQTNQLGIFNGAKRRRFMGSASSRLQPPGVDS